MGRAGDNPEKTYFRTERFFNADSQWYFATRESIDRGPYATRETAQSELTAYLRWRARKPAKAANQSASEPVAET